MHSREARTRRAHQSLTRKKLWRAPAFFGEQKRQPWRAHIKRAIRTGPWGREWGGAGGRWRREGWRGRVGRERARELYILRSTTTKRPQDHDNRLPVCPSLCPGTAPGCRCWPGGRSTCGCPAHTFYQRSVQPRVCRRAVCLDIGRGRASTLEREPTPPARHGSGNGHRGHDACVALTSPLSEKKRAPSLGERARAIQACKQPGGESLSPTPVLFVPGFASKETYS